MAGKKRSTAEQIKLAKKELDKLIAELEEDGLTDEEKVKIAKAKAAFENFKKELAKKQAAKKGTAPQPTKSGSEPPQRADVGEITFPPFLPVDLKIKNGAVSVQKKFAAELHKPLVKQLTYPIPGVPGLKLGGEVSIKSEAAISFGMTRIGKQNPKTFDWADYEVEVSAGLTIGGNFSLVLTDVAEILAAKFGVSVDVKLNEKKFKLTNFFEKGEMEVNLIGIECYLKGTIGAGQTLNELHRLIEGGDCPDFLAYEGKKYQLFVLGVKLNMDKSGIKPGRPVIEAGKGWDEMKKDFLAIKNKGLKLLEDFSEVAIDTAMNTVPTLILARMAYDVLCDLHGAWKNRHFNRNKHLYEKACRSAIRQMMERERKDPKKVKELAAIAKDPKKLQERYKKYMESAKNIPLIKELHAQLTANEVEDAEDTLNQLNTNIELQVAGTPTIVKKSDTIYQFHFKIRVKTDGPVVIPALETTLYCGGMRTDWEAEDANDEYDGPTNEVYSGYWLEINKADVEKYLKGKSYKDVKWRLRLRIDFKGRFKDVIVNKDVSKYIDLP